MFPPDIPSQVLLQSGLPYSVSVIMIQAIKQFMSCRPLLPYPPPLFHHWCSGFWNGVYKHYSHVCLTTWEGTGRAWIACARGNTLAPISTSPSQLFVFRCAFLFDSSAISWKNCVEAVYTKDPRDSMQLHDI